MKANVQMFEDNGDLVVVFKNPDSSIVDIIKKALGVEPVKITDLAPVEEPEPQKPRVPDFLLDSTESVRPVQAPAPPKKKIVIV